MTSEISNQKYYWALLNTGDVIPVEVVSRGEHHLDDIYAFGTDEPLMFFGNGPCPSWYRGSYVVRYVANITFEGEMYIE